MVHGTVENGLGCPILVDLPGQAPVDLTCTLHRGEAYPPAPSRHSLRSNLARLKIRPCNDSRHEERPPVSSPTNKYTRVPSVAGHLSFGLTSKALARTIASGI